MRIIAGRHRGHKLLPPPGKSVTRPITGMAKKSLFDILGPRLEGATVVDLYCGTGTLGLEALSRGAATCCFAECDRAVVDRLRRNIEALGVAKQCVIWPGDVTTRLIRWLEGLEPLVDIAFVDPPYAQTRSWSWDHADRRIFEPLAEKLSADGVVVLRLPRKTDIPKSLTSLSVHRTRTYGPMAIALLGRC